MNKSYLKLILWVGFLILAIGIVITSLRTIGVIFDFLKLGDQNTQEFIIFQKNPRLTNPELLIWEPDGPLPREMEGYTRDAIYEDYLLAYEELSFAFRTGHGHGLASYFQSSALDDVRLAVSTTPKTVMMDWRHRLTLHFYAPDGSMVSFSDVHWYFYYIMPTPEERNNQQVQPEVARLRIAKRRIMVNMHLDDGHWRIHHWRVLADDSYAQVLSEVQELELDENLSSFRGVNYMPRSSTLETWPDGWSHIDGDEVRRDLAQVKALGFNSVRYFIPYPLPETLDMLDTMQDAASEHGLRLIPMLMIQEKDYELINIGHLMTYVSRLLPYLRDVQVSLIDIGEIKTQDVERSAEMWALYHFLSVYLRHHTKKPLTVSSSTPPTCPVTIVDVCSLTYYGDVVALEHVLRQWQQKTPLLISEVGYHSNMRYLRDARTPLEQAHQAQSMIQATQHVGAGWFWWTLYDLPLLQGRVFGDEHGHMGVLDKEGMAKPLADVMLGETLPELPLWMSVWRQLVLGVIVIVLLLFLAGVIVGLWLGTRWFREGLVWVKKAL